MLTYKRWKDGIDIDHPTFAIQVFVKSILALKEGNLAGLAFATAIRAAVNVGGVK
jgi:hypothetical protein